MEAWETIKLLTENRGLKLYNDKYLIYLVNDDKDLNIDHLENGKYDLIPISTLKGDWEIKYEEISFFEALEKMKEGVCCEAGHIGKFQIVKEQLYFLNSDNDWILSKHKFNILKKFKWYVSIP